MLGTPGRLAPAPDTHTLDWRAAARCQRDRLWWSLGVGLGLKRLEPLHLLPHDGSNAHPVLPVPAVEPSLALGTPSPHVEHQPIPLTVTHAGAVRIAATRVPLETVIRAFHQDATAEEIAQDYPSRTLAHVYAVLASYLWHREAVDASIAERAAVSAAAHAAHAARFDPTGMRARLLAHQANTEHAA